MEKGIKTIVILALCLWIGTGNIIVAAAENISDEEQIETSEEEVVEDDLSDEVVEIAAKKEIETNFTSKEYEIDGESENHYLVVGGNEKAVNTLATEQNTAHATLTENVNVQGKPYNMEILDDEGYENKENLELRQFISFETKSGKVFHLVINHSKNGDNVMMLTEVGEQDLLNMIEEQADVEFELSESEPAVMGEEAGEEKQKSVEVSTTTSVSRETIDKEVNTDLIIIIAVAVIGGIGGWYFKIFKPKREALYNDEVDEADYLEDDDYLEDTEYLDEDKQV